MTGKISIIIPVHNSLAYTQNALMALYNALRKANDQSWKFEVIVVDDGSSDGTGSWIREHYPQIHLLTGNGSLWWSGSINLGMKYAVDELGSDYILWWNNDIFPAEDYFLNLISLVGNATEPIVYGSKIYMAEKPEIIWSYGGMFHRRWGHSYMPDSGQPDGPELKVPREADWLAGMGTLLPIEVVNNTGSLNQRDFPQYHGDLDYTLRAKRAGYKVVVFPELKIWNHTSHSGRSHENKLDRLIPTLSDTKSIYNFRKEWLLYRKYVRNPIAYFMLARKYLGYFVKFVLRVEG
jgi:GT2 family glycosyltransferase